MKKMLIGFVAVFIALEVLDILIHGVILVSTYMAMQNVWRTDMMAKMWVLHVVKIITAFFFALIFSKGYENKGIMEGIAIRLLCRNDREQRVCIWFVRKLSHSSYACDTLVLTDPWLSILSQGS